MRVLPAAVICFVLGLSAAHAQSASHVRAQLLADVSAAAAGEPFDVGVLLKIDPEWHVYWENPGDSGLATAVKFTVPEGWKIGELRFPVPKHFVQPGNVAGYGYEDEVLLIATVTPPRDGDSQSKTISAAVSWLVCKEVCIPGKQKLDLTIPVGPNAAGANKALFVEWRARLPVPAKSCADVESAAVAGELAADGSPTPFVIDVRNKGGAWKDVQWFPGAADDALVTDGVNVQAEGDHVSVSFQARVLPGQKLSTQILKSVLAYTDPSGKRRGVAIDVPLQVEGSTP